MKPIDSMYVLLKKPLTEIEQIYKQTGRSDDAAYDSRVRAALFLLRLEEAERGVIEHNIDHIASYIHHYLTEGGVPTGIFEYRIKEAVEHAKGASAECDLMKFETCSANELDIFGGDIELHFKALRKTYKDVGVVNEEGILPPKLEDRIYTAYARVLKVRRLRNECTQG